jgi:V-type H+-transporting ATPase subunit C
MSAASSAAASSSADAGAGTLKGLYYVLVTVPAREGSDPIFRAHAEKTADVGQSTLLKVPALQVGSLDALLQLGDLLSKIDGTVEAATRRVVQTLCDIVSGTPQWAVGSTTPDVFLTQFAWDERKYPYKVPLGEVVTRIQQQVERLDTDLRAKSTAYQTLARSIATDSRKDQGNLSTRSLHDVVKLEDLADTEYLTTLLVVVPRHMTKEWLATYETLTSFVLPRSAKAIKEDPEFVLYTVTMFRRVAEEFKNIAREKRFIVRDFNKDCLSKESREEREKKFEEKTSQEQKLIRWCKTNFAEVFSAWVHLKIIRSFVEAVLRYGHPTMFATILLKPFKKDEKRVMGSLQKHYQYLASAQSLMMTQDSAADIPAAVAGGQEKFYPFIHTILDLDLTRTD